MKLRLKWFLMVLLPSGMVDGSIAHAQTPREKPPLVVASKDFPESRLLGEIMAQLVERETDIPVQREFNLSSTAAFESLRDGEVDLYAEYTGTGLEEYVKVGRKVSNPLEAYAIVQDRMARKMNLRWLQPFGFDNSFALAMRSEQAERLGISKISDLREHQGELTVGVSHDFFKRNDGFEEMAAVYRLDGFARIDKIKHSYAYKAVSEGKNDVVDVWTTDGELSRFDLTILEDDLGFFPPYDCCPLIREDALRRYRPGVSLGDVLERLAFRIDNRKMQELNERIQELDSAGEPFAFRIVAREFLAELEVEGRPAERSDSFAGQVAWLTLEHLMLTGIAVGLAVLFAVPLGILLTRWEVAAGGVLGVTGVIQTIPSLALLVVMIPLFGLGAVPAIVALFLYALLPIVRNTYTGIRGVDADIVEAGRGIGLTDWQLLRRVQLPLAVRTIMAGVRTSAVISVGVATLAAFIGAGGLGDLIVTGLQLNNTKWILAGAIPSAALALLVDFGLGWVEHAVRPRGVSEN